MLRDCTHFADMSLPRDIRSDLLNAWDRRDEDGISAIEMAHPTMKKAIGNFVDELATQDGLGGIERPEWWWTV